MKRKEKIKTRRDYYKKKHNARISGGQEIAELIMQARVETLNWVLGD